MLGRYQDSGIQRSGDGGMTVMSTDLAHATATWVLEHLEPGERVTAVHSMTGGIINTPRPEVWSPPNGPTVDIGECEVHSRASKSCISGQRRGALQA